MTQSIWHTPLQLAPLNDRALDGLSRHLGIEFIEFGHDHLTARMPVAAHTYQPLGSLHGGATAALAETVGSVAANCCVDPTVRFCLGLELNINHLKAVTAGFIHAVARPLHIGRTTQVWDIQIYNDEKKRIAVARLTIAVIKKIPPENQEGFI